jgi:hypothetical protein
MYSFFVPLTARAWRRIGWEPLLLLVGDETEWRRDRRSACVLEEAAPQAEVVFVPRQPGAADYTLAQVVRLCAASLDGADDDYLVVSDVDMWPLGPQLFATRDLSCDFHLFNADAYGDPPDRFPICYMGGRRSAWRSIFELDGGLAAVLGRIPWPADGDWNFDERFATQRLRAWAGFDRRCQRIARAPGPAHGRIDRIAWNWDGRLEGLRDAHLCRPAFVDENWQRVGPLASALFGDSQADNYRRAYVSPAVGADDLAAAYYAWFREFARLAPEPYRSYGGYGDGLPNGTAASLEAIREFARLVDDPDAVILNAGAGASSFLLRRLFRNVVCVDADPAYLELVRRICVANGLDGERFIVGIEAAIDADFTFYDYGEIHDGLRIGHHATAFRKTRRAIYFDDADDRPHGFPRYRQVLLDFAAAQGIVAEDCRAAYDAWGRWGIVMRRPSPAAASGLIAFSLWGRDPLYLNGAVENIAKAAAFYPGFRLRFYTDDPAALDDAARTRTGHTAADNRHGVNVEIVEMPRASGMRGLFWRFLAASDQQADPILFRDCDSRLNAREAAAVAAWIESGRGFHVMHDHPHHADWPILAGMWGVRGGVVTDMDLRVGAWGRYDDKMADQRFLAAEIWPLAQRDVMHHASVPSCVAPAEPFPPHPPCSGFVGQIIPSGA